MNKAPTAWMLRQDGTAFPCQCHYYGNADPAEIEETLYAAEWLYESTLSVKTQRQCLELISAYGASLHSHRNSVRNLLQAIRERPYVFLSRAFVERHAAEFFYANPTRLPELNAAVNQALNHEFLRARLGGLYDTVPGNRDLYFCVSGANFDWLPSIRAFAEAHAADADTVTVLWDLESTGRSEYLTDEFGHVLNHVSLKRLLGLPVPSNSM